MGHPVYHIFLPVQHGLEETSVSFPNFEFTNAGRNQFFLLILRPITTFGPLQLATTQQGSSGSPVPAVAPRSPEQVVAFVEDLFGRRRAKFRQWHGHGVGVGRLVLLG